MKHSTKTVFDLPELIALDGTELTEDKFLQELTANQTCMVGGSPPKCSCGCKLEPEVV
jgi:hypothetical protein